MNAVSILAWGKVSYEIHTDLLPGPTWHRQCLQLAIWTVTFCLSPLADITRVYILFDILIYGGPVELSTYKLRRLFDTEVACQWIIMMAFEQFLYHCFLRRNINSLAAS